MQPRALLAIRSDIAPSIESEYLDWLTKEHTIERVGIEGFVSARIFRCERNDIRRYLILYELENAAIVDSTAYLERLNNPTEWSARMMPNLGNFVRGGGEVTENLGAGYGAAMVPLLVQSDALPLDPVLLKALSEASQVVAVRLLQVDPGRTSVPTNERAMRLGDRTFRKLLMLEALDKAAVLAAMKRIYPALLEAVGEETGEDIAYSLIFSLTDASLQTQKCAAS